MIWFVLLGLAGLTGCVAGQAGQTAFSSTWGALHAALEDPDVSTIVVTRSIEVKHDHSASHDPIEVNRNLTIQGQPGSDAVLDLSFGDGLLQLCATCTFTVRNLIVTNDRWGTGPEYDILVGTPGSRVVSENVLRLRQACTPPLLPFKTINGSRRSTAFPDADQPQLLSIQAVNVLGQQFPESLVYKDVSLDVPREHNEGLGFIGGYALRLKRDVLLCQHTVSKDCLARKSGAACVYELLDKLTEGDEHDASIKEAAAVKTTTKDGFLAFPARVAAVVSVIVVTVLALFVIVVLMVRKHRLKLALAEARQASLERDGGYKDGGKDIEEGAAVDSFTLAPMGARKGWELYSSLTSPLVGDVEDDTIQFGELVGAGSFGRVFKGRWAGRTVAIKVIEHSSSTIEAVENEVRLMLSFNHQHLVRALHCVTFVAPFGTTNSDRSSGDYDVVGIGSFPHQSGNQAADTAMDSDTCHQPAQQQLASQDSNAHMSTNGSAYGYTPSVKLGSANCTCGGSSIPSTIGRRVETRLVLEFCDCGTLREYCSQFWRPQQQLEQQWDPQDQQQQQQPDRQQQQQQQDRQQQQEQQQQQELCDGSSEQDLLRLLVLLHGAAAGLEVLHSNNVVHGDLNAQNVLVSSSANAPFGAVAKVADLGLARVMGDNRTHRTTQTLGTMNHMAPEQLRSGKMSPAADIYAFGIMVYELYTGTTAFRKLQHVGQFYETIVVHNLRPLVPQHMPADLRLLMEHCWTAEPQSRPSGSKVAECLRMMIQDCQQKAALLPGIAEGAADGGAAEHEQQQQPQQQQESEQNQVLQPQRRRMSVNSGFFRFGSRGSSRSGSAAGSRLGSRSGLSMWRLGSRNSGSFMSQDSACMSARGGAGYSAYDFTYTYTCSNSSGCDTLGTLDTCGTLGTCDTYGTCETYTTCDDTTNYGSAGSRSDQGSSNSSRRWYRPAQPMAAGNAGKAPGAAVTATATAAAAADIAAAQPGWQRSQASYAAGGNNNSSNNNSYSGSPSTASAGTAGAADKSWLGNLREGSFTSLFSNIKEGSFTWKRGGGGLARENSKASHPGLWFV